MPEGQRSLLDLATAACCLPVDVLCSDVDDAFRDDDTLSSVLLVGEDEQWLVDRGRFLLSMGGPAGWTLNAHRTARTVAGRPPTLMEPDLDAVRASRVILDRPSEQRYDDVILRDDEGAFWTLPVARLLEELVTLYGYKAVHDGLTGLPNRTLLMDRLELYLRQVQRTDEQVGVLFIDLDGFKPVNDRLGHNVGDELLRQVAGRLIDALRASDTVARVGGDEFVVALRVAAEADVEPLAQRVVDVLTEPFELLTEVVTIGASVGVAVAPEGRTGAGAVMRAADAAMYQAKREGGNHYVLFDSSSMVEEEQSRRREAALREAIAMGGLLVHYQPMVDLQNGHRIDSVEALVRWRTDDGTLVPPDEFIPLAERSGLIHEIGDAVLVLACAQMSRWDRKLLDRAPKYMSVNLSAAQLADPELPERIDARIDRLGLDPTRFVLEVTETAMLRDLQGAIGQLQRLRDLGCGIAIDDFGVGHSTLSQLTRLPVTQLKIDRSFITRMREEPADRRVVQLIINFGHELGLEIVAEGLELASDAADLAEMGARWGQGWHFGKPLKGSEMVKLLDGGAA